MVAPNPPTSAPLVVAAERGRLVSMSRAGRHVVIRDGEGDRADGLAIVDALGTDPRLHVNVANVVDFVCVGEHLWTVSSDEVVVWSLDGVVVARTPVSIDSRGVLVGASGPKATTAIWTGSGPHLFRLESSRIAVSDPAALAPSVGEDRTVLASLHGARFAASSGREISIADVGKAPHLTVRLPGDGTLEEAAEILGGRAVVLLSRQGASISLDIIRPRGSLVHHLEHDDARSVAIAETRGLALITSSDGTLTAIDLRYGRSIGEAAAPLTDAHLAIDAKGRYIAMAGVADGHSRLSVFHVAFAEVFGGARPRAELPESASSAAQADAAELDAADADETDPGHDLATEDDAADADDFGDDVEIPNVPLVALARPAEPIRLQSSTDATPYGTAVEHLADSLDLVAARAARAIVDAWDSGALSIPSEDRYPFEREVNALIGSRARAAPDLLVEATARLETISQTVGARTAATLAAGIRLPLFEVARQFNLSAVATQILMVVATPSLRGDAARLYGILTNDGARPICDRALVEEIVGGRDAELRARVAHELRIDSPLLARGLVRELGVPADQVMFAPLAVDSTLISRLRGDPYADGGAGAITHIRHADCTLAELAMPRRLVRDVVLALAEPSGAQGPVRLVIRGRPGFGRTSLLAALAERAGMPLAVIDSERLQRGNPFPSALRAELLRAALRGAIPCVVGLEDRPVEEVNQTEHLREVFRTFDGPVLMRTSVEYKPPLDAGFTSFVLPTLSESQRLEFWQQTLDDVGLTASAERLASRYRIGPGTIVSVIDVVANRPHAADQDVTTELEDVARQRLESRIGGVANRIERLARWEQVALPDDTIDSVREMIGRLNHRRTVYDAWGFDRKMITSRGLTALFYGPPGTGKTMVAGLIARELGLDLYRVDLGNVSSKWIGETEKNLGRVFDAAEDGQAVILFDEADSLFAKRTEVKSSVDRYANLEVNYLLQRLDTFEGVAILTTNMEGSIDTAFKRRLSLRLEFRFPDEEMRVRLWAAHIPPEAPVQGDFDFASLARRFPMSGGYIRNSVLRAAFLAAQEGESLSQRHIERAITLEYQSMGKLSPGGRMV